VFYGEYEHALDDKARVTIPSKWREILSGRSITSLMLTRSVLDPCLAIYPPAEWERIEAKIRDLPWSDPSARRYRRRLFSGAAEAAPDRAGRILLPANLRDYAGIVRDVVFAGVSTHIELWAADRWSAAQVLLDADEDLASGLQDLGL